MNINGNPNNAIKNPFLSILFSLYNKIRISNIQYPNLLSTRDKTLKVKGGVIYET